MPYDYKAEVKRVRDYYASDPLQKRFSALITGESGSGKTFLARTCRFPIHIDSFDPGGTKCLRKWIESGDIIADTRWENEDPYKPSVYEEWKKDTDLRFETGYFNNFGTYILDSLSTFGDAIMNSVLDKADIAGQQPRFRKDYAPQKIDLVNRVKKFMTLPCDFIVTGHLDRLQEPIGKDKYGDPIYDVKFRLRVTGNAVVTVPMLFDELYIVKGKETSTGPTAVLVTYAQGKYLARSRLRSDGKLDVEENADVKKLLSKIGLDWSDKPKLEL